MNSPLSPSSSPQSSAGLTRRELLQTLGLGGVAAGLSGSAFAASPKGGKIQGFEEASVQDASKGWEPISSRKVRVGLAGYGVCKFAAAFGFQDHPNVEIVAVTDLIPERCAALAKAVRCGKTYPSVEEMVKDRNIEAIYVATDAPSHARLCLEALKHGKDVATAVPAVYGNLEEADLLLEAVKRSGRKYMMFETSAFHEANHAMRQIYRAGGLGEIVYSEGQYIHYMPTPIDSYQGWRDGAIPMWYPTHATAYPICVTSGSFTAVSCVGRPSALPSLRNGNNKYKNPFGTQVALFRTSEGGMARILTTKDTPGFGSESGFVRGTLGSFVGSFAGADKDKGGAKNLPNLRRPPLPPGVRPGGHGGSHGYLMNEFITALLQDRQPLVHVAMSLNLTVPGIIAHQSALKDGEWLKVPQYRL
ncbi:MAG: Gfo/Idh/MocA family oxidoreductase [Verrucomicrobia bacterium]|nr:Gfo/Idh/MocA family oxidoreductase [Verrucomicrobiota bacterium]